MRAIPEETDVHAPPGVRLHRSAPPGRRRGRGVRAGAAARCATILVAVAVLGATPGAAAASVPPSVPSEPPPSCRAVPAVAGGPWADAVIYEAFVRSFADADGDGIGDLAGMRARLDHLNDGDPATMDDLGVTALWLMPIHPSPSYHGYDVTDHRAVDPDLGSMDDLRALVDAAHARGIRVLLDLVVNHTARTHPWFTEALAGGPARERYLWASTDPGWPAVAGPRPWHPAGAAWYYGVFDAGMPDLDLRDPWVTDELRAIARFWLTEAGVDGFRIDAAKHLVENGPNAQVDQPESRAWLAGFRDAIHAVRPDALVLGEVWDSRPVAGRYIGEGALDMATDFATGDAVVAAIGGLNGTALAAAQAGLAPAYAGGLAATFLRNHDQERLATTFGERTDPLRLAAATLLTGPGVPVLYYGEEIGLPGGKPDPRIRTPLPWSGDGPGFGFTAGTPWQPFMEGAETRNVAAQGGDPASLLSTYRALIRLRAAHPALGGAGGTWAARTDARNAAAIVRALGDARIVVLHNVTGRPAPDVTIDRAEGPLCGTPTARLLWASDGSRPAITPPAITAAGGLAGWTPVAELAPWTTLVIALEQ
ncbi:MAG: alpha-amylase family glycosyl hydrolase [Chloroflexota bacterium]